MNQVSSRDIDQMRQEISALIEKVGEQLADANLPEKDKTRVIVSARKKLFWFFTGYSHHIVWERSHLLPLKTTELLGVTESGRLVRFNSLIGAFDSKNRPIRYRHYYVKVDTTCDTWQVISVQDVQVDRLPELRDTLLAHLN